MPKPNAIISCGALVYRKHDGKVQVLLIKQSAKTPGWGIPKGHMEYGENYVKTACREVFEEAGVKIKVITRLPHVIIEKGSYRKIVVPYLAIQVCDSIPRCDNKNSEVSDVGWFDLNDLPSIYAYQRPIFDAASLILGGYVGE